MQVSPRAIQIAIDDGIKDGLIEKPQVTEVQQILSKLGFAPGKKEGVLGYIFKTMKS